MIISKIYQKRFEKDKKRKNEIWRVIISKFLQKYIDPNDTVLEIGCGYCEFINNINCKTKIGVEINKESKLFVNKDVKLLNCESRKIKLTSCSINKIFISNFFEHITKDEIIDTIKEIYRILKPGGKVLILQPNIRYCYKDYWMFFDHITPIDDRALEEIFRVLNFKLDKKIEKFLPYSTKSRLPKNLLYLKIYLSFPFIWRIFGKQSFLIFKK